MVANALLLDFVNILRKPLWLMASTDRDNTGWLMWRVRALSSRHPGSNSSPATSTKFWASYLASLCLSELICIMWKTTVLFHKTAVRVK